MWWEGFQRKPWVCALVGLNCPYEIDWNAAKSDEPLLEVRGFIEEGRSVKRGQVQLRHHMNWSRSVSVEDATSSELPDVIYARVSCLGSVWNERTGRTQFGGSSWDVNLAFVSKELAEASLCDHKDERGWERSWIVPMMRIHG